MHTTSSRSSQDSSGALQQVMQQQGGKPDSDTGICRLCLEEDGVDDLVSCCRCMGSIRYIHARCLQQWQHTLWSQGLFDRVGHCDICRQPYQAPHQFDPNASVPLWQRLKRHWLQLQSSPELAFRAWRCCILIGGLAAGTHHGVAGFGAGLNLGLRMARPLANLTFRLMPQLSVAAAMLPSLAPMLRNALRCSCSLMLLEVAVTTAAGLFGGGLVGFCLGTVGVVKLSAKVVTQGAGVAARAAAGAAWPRALALLLLKGGRRLQLSK